MLIARSEYPRPDLVRSDWHSLNGEWHFAFDDDDAGGSKGWHTGHDFPLRIQVPFAYQAPLSGIHQREFHDVIWYRRFFEVPNGWYGRRVRLNFGAVDFEATVFINGKLAAMHSGGNTPFSADITPLLATDNHNEIVVRVLDNQRRAQPRGKQHWRPESSGIWYNRTSGIWQSVWLEPVSDSFIERLHIKSWDLEGRVEVDVYLNRYQHGATVRGEAFFDAQRVAYAESLAMSDDSSRTSARIVRLNLQVPDPRLWSVERPHLYALKLSLKSGDQILDYVESYFGIRSLEVYGGSVLLNGASLYQRLVLDQGYWPDGLLTAPSDDELRNDIVRMKEMGFNGCRKHMKAEDPRFLYWADKLGYLVWGEMAAPWEFSDVSIRYFTAEWQEAVLRDRSHPCVITWTPINESWGIEERTVSVRPDQIAWLDALYHLTKSLDPSRPVNGNDGWQNPTTDLATIHDYTQNGKLLQSRMLTYLENPDFSTPFAPTLIQHLPGHLYRGQPVIVTEFGGIGLSPDGGGWGYGNNVRSPEELLARFDSLVKTLQKIPRCVGYCYTQLSDVEQEHNGLYTYDRKPKVAPERVRQINERRS